MAPDMNQNDLISLFNHYNRIHNQFTTVKRKLVCREGGNSIFPAEMNILVFLNEWPDSTVTEIASYLYVSKSAASQMVKKLAGKEYIIKQRSADEERIIRQTLTDKGKEAVAEFTDTQSEAFRDIIALFGSLSEEEITAVRKLLNTLEQIFDRKLGYFFYYYS